MTDFFNASSDSLIPSHEQEIAAVVAGFADVGKLWRLVGVDHHRAADDIEQ